MLSKRRNKTDNKVARPRLSYSHGTKQRQWIVNSRSRSYLGRNGLYYLDSKLIFRMKNVIGSMVVVWHCSMNQ